MPILGFQDHAKVDVTPNIALPLIITATIINQFVSEILIDDEILCNSIYLRIFTEVNLILNDSSTLHVNM